MFFYPTVNSNLFYAHKVIQFLMIALLVGTMFVSILNPPEAPAPVWWVIPAIAAGAVIGGAIVAGIFLLADDDSEPTCGHCGLEIPSITDSIEHPHLDFCKHHDNSQEGYYYTCPAFRYK